MQTNLSGIRASGTPQPPRAMEVVYAQKGDTLGDVATRYGVDETQLRQTNPKLGDRLLEGEAVQLPHPEEIGSCQREHAPSKQPASSLPGAYMSAPTGDGKLPVQRYLERNAPLYESPAGAGVYGLARTLGASEQTARQMGGVVAVAGAVVSAGTLGGARKAEPLQPVGMEKKNPRIATFVNEQKQARHMQGTPQYDDGGYFKDMGDAQEVMQAYQRGEAKVVGRGSDGGPIVECRGVTGYNNNPEAGFKDQPTQRFWIKGSSSPSVVPVSPVRANKQ